MLQRTFMADNLPAFTAGKSVLRFVAAIDFLLLAYTDSFKLHRETHFRYQQNSVKPISAIS
jgi:hypothetical protein